MSNNNMKKAINRIRELHQSGMMQKDMPAVLNKEGLTTKRGRPWNFSNITQYMNKKNLKRIKKTPQDNLLSNITDILTSNIDESLKARLIGALVK